ncbi:MAG: hypothetical protein E7269_02955 [Lachnospiraceae bacterium]|nr:hypothetical protein [Lachnospiraceae bacterium]
MRIWGKIFKDNRLLKDTVFSTDENTNRTRKIFNGLEEICYKFDLGVPIWLDNNINEFKRLNKTRFYQDSFIEKIDFDFLEFHILEE